MKNALWILIGMTLAEVSHHTLHLCSASAIIVGVAFLGLLKIGSTLIDNFEKATGIEG